MCAYSSVQLDKSRVEKEFTVKDRAHRCCSANGDWSAWSHTKPYRRERPVHSHVRHEILRVLYSNGGLFLGVWATNFVLISVHIV